MTKSKFKFFKAPLAYSDDSDWRGVFLWDVKGGRIRQILPYESKTSFSGINLEDIHYYNSLKNNESFREISLEQAQSICYNFDFSALGRSAHKQDLEAAIPFPTKFSMKYRTAKGIINNYQILGVLEKNSKSFIGYAAKRGPRRFKFERVISIA